VSSVFGLGNPGPRYSRTRHNVGFRVIERLAERWRARRRDDTPEYRWWEAERNGREVALVQPLTFMNASGMAVAKFRDRHGLEPQELLVVADDVYLPLGTVRVRARGSNGGHRGLESIEATLGTLEYSRLRIGVGAAESAEALREHVLEGFTPEEESEVEASLGRAAEIVECWADEGVLAAMNRFNRRVGKEVPEP
jgi:PTH1 family peptidyl-tRNA hydrolase